LATRSNASRNLRRSLVCAAWSCSPLEIVALRQILPSKIQPRHSRYPHRRGKGRRPETHPYSPGSIDAGANWLVIGRPIYARHQSPRRRPNPSSPRFVKNAPFAVSAVLIRATRSLAGSSRGRCAPVAPHHNPASLQDAGDLARILSVVKLLLDNKPTWICLFSPSSTQNNLEDGCGLKAQRLTGEPVNLG